MDCGVPTYLDGAAVSHTLKVVSQNADPLANYYIKAGAGWYSRKKRRKSTASVHPEI